MKVHEYQGKEVLERYGVRTQRGIVVDTPEEASAAFAKLGGDLAVVKAQIHAGGRGKGGGVKLVKSAEEAAEVTGNMLGMMLKTHQTGPEGQEVRKVFVCEGLDLARELYVGIALDRAIGKPVLMVSAEGGMEIETLAVERPEALLKMAIDPALGLQAHQARRAAFFLGLPTKRACALLNDFGHHVGFDRINTAYAASNSSLQVSVGTHRRSRRNRRHVAGITSSVGSAATQVDHRT